MSASARKNDVMTRWVSFRLDGQLYGLAIGEVQEVLASADIEPVPGAPPFVLGVINLRGHIVTVLDLRSCLGTRTAADGASCLVIANSGSQLLGFCVDGIADVVNIPQARIQPPLELSTMPAARAVRGLIKRKDEVLTLLDVGQLVPAAA
ncbi:MAG TPA: chemotaxis protein CheW [Nevskiaceae bacterium]|nr:chemotaxis protein CheW [Nevskiaceae bacterium]